MTDTRTYTQEELERSFRLAFALRDDLAEWLKGTFTNDFRLEAIDEQAIYDLSEQLITTGWIKRVEEAE